MKTPEPYRVLFPLGFAYALIGAGLWPLHALGWVPYPGPLHRALMMQGFETSFVLGFLLTALPGFTHGARCHPLELAIAALASTVFGAAALAGQAVVAQAAFVAAALMLAVAAARRLGPASLAPPQEFMFVLFGLALGLAGGLIQLGEALGIAQTVTPRLGERLISLGMVLSLVLGVGGLLVPVFAGMRDPLMIPGIAKPHERAGRRPFYFALMAAFALAFAAESFGHPGWGGTLRAAAASALLLLVWKITCRPGRRDVPAWSLWTAGWMVFAGLWLAVLLPLHATAALHLAFIGGFGLLTFGIATRVVIAHGKHPLDDERRTLTPWVVGVLAIALLARLAAELVPARPLHALGLSGAAWVAAWLLWGARAMPRLAKTAPARTTLPPRV